MIKLIALDMDGTIIQYNNFFQSSWHKILEVYGFNEELKKNYIKYYHPNQRDKDHEWAIEEASYLKGQPVQLALDHLLPPPYSPGLEEFLEKTKGKIIRGIITTGLSLVAEPIAKKFDLEFVKANILHKKNDFFTGGLDYWVPLWKKDSVLEKVAQEFNINPKEVCFIGDNINDPFDKVGLSIAFNPKVDTIKADYTINHFKQLEEIKELKNAQIF